MAKLSKFEGQDVITAGIEIPRAGGGLHDALAVEPRELHVGDEVHIVMRCTTTKVRFDPVRDTDSLSRVHVLSAEEATFVDGDLVEEQLAEMRRRVEELHEKETGEPKLPMPVEDAHGRGR